MSLVEEYALPAHVFSILGSTGQSAVGALLVSSSSPQTPRSPTAPNRTPHATIARCLGRLLALLQPLGGPKTLERTRTENGGGADATESRERTLWRSADSEVSYLHTYSYLQAFRPPCNFRVQKGLILLVADYTGLGSI